MKVHIHFGRMQFVHMMPTEISAMGYADIVSYCNIFSYQNGGLTFPRGGNITI